MRGLSKHLSVLLKSLAQMGATFKPLRGAAVIEIVATMQTKQLRP
jgi:hypothetical protein